MEQKVVGIRINIYELESMILELDQINQVVINIVKNRLRVLVYQIDNELKNQDNLKKYLYKYIDKRIPISIDYSESKLKFNKSGKIDRAFYKNIFYK